MRVVKTIAERRKNSRPKLSPIRLKFGGIAYETNEWTLGGFLIEAYRGEYRVGSTISVEIFIDIDKETIKHTVYCEVARVDNREGKLAATFIELEPEILDSLESWMTGRLRRQRAARCDMCTAAPRGSPRVDAAAA